MTEPPNTEALLAIVREALEQMPQHSSPAGWNVTADPKAAHAALDTIASELERLTGRNQFLSTEQIRADIAEAELERLKKAYGGKNEPRFTVQEASLVAELERVRAERDYFRNRLPDFSAVQQADFARAEETQARLDRAVEALRQIGLTPMIVGTRRAWAEKWQEIARAALAEIEKPG